MKPAFPCTSKLLVLATLAAFSPACGDDVPSATDTQSETSPSTEDTNGETETESGGEPDMGGEIDTDTDGEDCSTAAPIGDWLFSLTDGDFPNDVPTDVDETCTVVEFNEPGSFALDCPFGGIALSLLYPDLPPLPEVGASAQLRLHHEPGWLNWPDLWIDVEVVGGDHWSFMTSSTLAPTVGAYAVPWQVAQTSTECGPYLAEDDFGPDPCGEQLALELEFLVDGQTVTAWDKAHTSTIVDGRAFEAWITAAREYTNLPEFCDVSPTWYALAARREGAG